MQTGFLWKREGLDWDFTRISPIGGFSRLFSIRSFTLDCKVSPVST